ncbi:MAG: hypothetical protein RBS56_04515 [Candidatus Gracilibacteria bacterium]|jgi:hypothetical protein|nr:hypothetical protein [Candidatus Gracilibacteria bacterium]
MQDGSIPEKIFPKTQSTLPEVVDVDDPEFCAIRLAESIHEDINACLSKYPLEVIEKNPKLLLDNFFNNN